MKAPSFSLKIRNKGSLVPSNATAALAVALLPPLVLILLMLTVLLPFLAFVFVTSLY
jgi:hypothetical protein